MFQKSQLINRRPNVRQYTDRLRDVQDDDDDDQGISSFARSKVDDDDEKFKNQNSDPDFLDNLLRKKSRQDSKSNNSSMLPSTPPPPSAGKKTEPDVSNTDPKKGQPTTQNNSANNKEPQKTPVRQNSTQAFQTPDPKQSQPQPKTPQPPPQPPQQQTPITNKTPVAKETPKNPPVQPPKPTTPANPKVTTPVNPKITTPAANPKPVTPSNPKQATPAAPPKVVEPPVTINKTPAKREETPTQQPLQIEEPKVPEVSSKDRPNFVRRGKLVAAVKEIVNTIKTLQEDKITAYEPKNNIEVNKKLSLRFAPQKPYVDPTFPPNDLQVFQVFGNGKVEFKRINLNRDLDTHQVVDPNDITPGSQASSLMQVLAAIAEQPSIVARILEDQTINENGFYYARLCIGGVWKYILLDDHLGYLNGQPVGATSTVDPNKLKPLSKSNPGYQSELWPFLIEKAFAKEYGSYQDAANKATVADFLAEVTGAPVVTQPIDEQILNSLTSTSVALVHLNDGVYTYLSKDSNSVTLRNPWGWNGKPPQTAQPEGEFKVPLKDVQGKPITIAKYDPQNYSVSYNAKAEHDAYSAFNVVFDAPTVATFGFHQRDQRYFRNNIALKYDYSFARILVFNDQQELIGQVSGQQKSLAIEVDVEKGKYTVVTIIDFQTEQVYDSTFTYYGPNPIRISRNNYRETPNLLATLLTKEALTQGQRKTSGQVEEYVYQAPFKLTVIAWKYGGTGNTKWSKDLSKQANRQNMKPLTFTNPQDALQITKLTTEQLKQLKQSSWQSAQSFNIDFTSTNTTHAVVFK